MEKINCCLRYELQPRSQLVELRTFLATSILSSKHYESDETRFPWTDERRTKHFDS